MAITCTVRFVEPAPEELNISAAPVRANFISTSILFVRVVIVRVAVKYGVGFSVTNRINTSIMLYRTAMTTIRWGR